MFPRFDGIRVSNKFSCCTENPLLTGSCLVSVYILPIEEIFRGIRILEEFQTSWGARLSCASYVGEIRLHRGWWN